MYIAVLPIDESSGQQWLMPETQLTCTRIKVPNRRPPDLLRAFIPGAGQFPILVFRRWEAIYVYARWPVPLLHWQRLMLKTVSIESNEITRSLSPSRKHRRNQPSIEGAAMVALL